MIFTDHLGLVCRSRDIAFRPAFWHPGDKPCMEIHDSGFFDLFHGFCFIYRNGEFLHNG